MRKGLLLGVVLIAVFMVGCDGRLLLNVDVPIVVEPAPPRYDAEVSGYLSYNVHTHHIRLTSRPNYDRHYEPLRDARVAAIGTGRDVRTGRDGYFFLGQLPHGRVNLRIQHGWVGPHNGVYMTVRSK